MLSRTKLGLYALIALAFLVVTSHLIQSLTGWKGFMSGSSYFFEYKSASIMKVVQKSLQGKKGTFAVYIEDLGSREKYGLNENQTFPAASLYKLVLMALVLKETEKGGLKLDDTVSSTKSHLREVLGGDDFGYEGAPEDLEYTVEEALTRVGSISDNFAAIMLTEKIRSARNPGQVDPLAGMAYELGMKNTNFASEPSSTTALDIALYFKALYDGQIISKQSSEKISDLLGKSKINDRIPAKLPFSTRVVHKTGELPRVRHDAGIIYPPNFPNSPYLLVLLSQDLQFEDTGVETLAQLSKDIYDYFQAESAKR